MAKTLSSGMYLMRIPNPHYSQLKSDRCWWAWADPLILSGDLQLMTVPWEYPDMTDLGVIDQQRRNIAVVTAMAQHAGEATNGIDFLAKDGNVYRGFALWSDVQPWPAACGFVAKLWDGIGEGAQLEAAFEGGRIADPYTELDAARDAAESTARKAGEVAAAAPGAVADALDATADVMPWWAKGLALVAGAGVAAYAWRTFVPKGRG